jgi:hypothetical protein
MISKNDASVEFSRIMQVKYNTNDLNSMAKEFIVNPEFGKNTIADILGILNNVEELGLLCPEGFSADALEFLKHSYVNMRSYLPGGLGFEWIVGADVGLDVEC